MYRIELTPDAAKELAGFPAQDRAAVVRAIAVHLTREPTAPTRRRKMLPGLIPPFDALLPIRQLRVGDVRVFYDVEEQERIVRVRAIRRKRPHETTEQIL